LKWRVLSGGALCAISIALIGLLILAITLDGEVRELDRQRQQNMRELNAALDHQQDLVKKLIEELNRRSCTGGTCVNTRGSDLVKEPTP
jgi:hypothetical protein